MISIFLNNILLANRIFYSTTEVKQIYFYFNLIKIMWQIIPEIIYSTEII